MATRAMKRPVLVLICMLTAKVCEGNTRHKSTTDNEGHGVSDKRAAQDGRGHADLIVMRIQGTHNKQMLARIDHRCKHKIEWR